MNILKIVKLLFTKGAKEVAEGIEDAAEWTRENVVNTLRLLYLAVAVSAVMLVIGVTLGGIGESVDSSGLISVGKFIIRLAGLFSAILFALFWLRATVLSYLVVVATKGVGVVCSKLPSLERSEAEKSSRWLRGITAWLTGVCLYAQIIPIWRHVGASITIATALMAISAIATAGWFQGKSFKYLFAAFVASVFVFSTLSLVHPPFARGVEQQAESLLDRFSSWSERHEKLGEVAKKADQASGDIDKDLLKLLTDRQNEIKKDAVQRCGGNFCSEEDKRQYAELAERIAKVKEGTYWSPENAEEGKKTAPVAAPASAPAASAPPATPAKRSAVKPAVTTRRVKNDWDNVFKELENYPVR